MGGSVFSPSYPYFGTAVGHRPSPYQDKEHALEIVAPNWFPLFTRAHLSFGQHATAPPGNLRNALQTHGRWNAGRDCSTSTTGSFSRSSSGSEGPPPLLSPELEDNFTVVVDGELIVLDDVTKQVKGNIFSKINSYDRQARFSTSPLHSIWCGARRFVSLCCILYHMISYTAV